MPARILAGDEHREFERVDEAELRKVFRGRHSHEHVPALQRPLETCIGMTGRARSSSFRGPVSQSLNRGAYLETTEEQKGVALTQTGKRSNYLLGPVVLLLIVACGGKNTSENTSESSAACKQGCYRGHGVSFNYPPKWQKGTDLGAPISALSIVSVVRDFKYLDYVEIVGEGQSELGFPRRT